MVIFTQCLLSLAFCWSVEVVYALELCFCLGRCCLPSAFPGLLILLVGVLVGLASGRAFVCMVACLTTQETSVTALLDEGRTTSGLKSLEELEGLAELLRIGTFV